MEAECCLPVKRSNDARHCCSVSQFSVKFQHHEGEKKLKNHRGRERPLSCVKAWNVLSSADS